MIPECREFKSPHPHYDEPTTSFTDFGLWLKRKHNISDVTIIGKIKKGKAIQRHVNLWNQEAVRNYIQDSPFKNGYKNNLGYAYADWCEYQGFGYDHQRFPTERELPYIPLEKEIDQLIGAFKNSKYGSLLQLLKETAFRPIEAMNLSVKDFDLGRQLVTLNDPAKGSNPGQVKMSIRLTSMISLLIEGKNLNEKVWTSKPKSIRRTFNRIRNNTSKKLGTPNLNRITLKTFRHFKATMEYHKTKDILYIKELLGHKNINNTLIYTHLVNWESDDYVCRTAKAIQDAKELIESGFEYVCEINNIRLFRKRK